MKKTFIFTIILMLTMAVQAQRFDWVTSWYGSSGSGVENPGNDIIGTVFDSEGNIYVLGCYYPGAQPFGVDPVPMDIATPNNKSAVIAKLNPDGGLVWCKGIHSCKRTNGTGYVSPMGIRLVGDTAIMITALLTLPGYDADNKLYYLDTLVESIIPYDTLMSNVSAFITLDLEGNLVEDHFLHMGGMFSNGEPIYVTNRVVSVLTMNQKSFVVDSDGNIYILRVPVVDEFYDIDTSYIDTSGAESSQFSVANGMVGALRVIVDGRGDIYYRPQHNSQKWNLQIMKFSPHFERLLGAVYLFDSTDVYHTSDLFGNNSGSHMYKPTVKPTSFEMDEANNLYLWFTVYHPRSYIPLCNTDTYAFRAHVQEGYANMLIKYDSSLTPLFAEQLQCTEVGGMPQGQYRSFSSRSVFIDETTNTIYLSGQSGRILLGVTPQEYDYATTIHWGNDTLDLWNNMYWLRIDRDNGSLVSYGKARSEFATELMTSGNGYIDSRMGVANGTVSATFNYLHNFSFADTTVDRGSSSSWATALGIWDEDGNELACYDFNAENDYNRNRGVYLKDSALYITGVVFSSATFGDTMLYNSGVQAFIAKYVNPIFIQQNGTREQQHIVWNQTLDFSAQPSPIALNATATSGLPVYYASSNPGVAYIDGENLFFAGEGDATVTATQPGNYLFFAAQPVTKPVITPSGHNPGTDGIEEAAGSQQMAVSVYPNPTAGLVYVKTDGMPITDITIHNSMGVRARTEQINGDSNHMTLDLSTLPAGVYYLTVKSGETTTRYKVVKTK